MIISQKEKLIQTSIQFRYSDEGKLSAFPKVNEVRSMEEKYQF